MTSSNQPSELKIIDAISDSEQNRPGTNHLSEDSELDSSLSDMFSDMGSTTSTSTEVAVKDSSSPAIVARKNVPGMMKMEQLSEKERALVGNIVKSLDPRNPTATLNYCSDIRKPINDLSQQIITGATNKDTGLIGEALVDMTMKIKGIDGSQLSGKKGFIAKLMNRAANVQAFVEKYNSVDSQINNAIATLESHRINLMESEEFLQRLYDKTIAFYRQLELRILALDEAIYYAQSELLPKLEQIAKQEGSSFEQQQEYRNVKSNIDDMERKFADLLITRSITQMKIPSISVMQENDRSLIRKITSQLTDTVAIWRDNIALAINIAKTQSAADAVKVVSDTSDRLIESTAKMLRTSNASVRTEIERTSVSIDVVKRANEELIGMLSDTISIVNQGKENRKKIAEEVASTEVQLKQALVGFVQQK